jgi:hypothetical protein
MPIEFLPICDEPVKNDHDHSFYGPLKNHATCKNIRINDYEFLTRNSENVNITPENALKKLNTHIEKMETKFLMFSQFDISTDYWYHSRHSKQRIYLDPRDGAFWKEKLNLKSTLLSL